MGNACGCFGSQGNTDAIKSIILDIQKQHGTQDIKELIQLIDYALLQIKAPGEAAGSSTHLESLASATTSASQIIDITLEEADRMSTSELFKELGGTAVNVLKGIGETHWIFLGLSLVASSLQRYLTMKSNASECMDLLEKLVELAKDVKKFEEAVTGETERVQKSVQVIVEGVWICCEYISKGRASRYFTANTMESQLQKTEENIRDLRDSLTSGGVIHIAKQITKRYVLSPLQLLDFKPEGIDDQIRQVKEKLDMDGSEPAVAVVLWGHGGIGKTTLAASVIQDLYSEPTDFKFSRVIIDQKTPDKISHIVKLQRDMLFDFGGGKVYLRDPAEGRQRLREVMANKYCFVYIDNVVDNDIKELLPPFETSDPQKSDPLWEKQKSKLRIIITSRENNLKGLLDIKINEDYHVEILSPEVARSLLAKTILQGEVKLHEQFDEMALITAVVQACQGVPILLSVFGNHLKVERKEGGYKDVLRAYTDVLQALQKGKLDKYNSGDEELLSEKLFFVYNKMRDEEAKEAFLDICTYFHGCEWDQVAHIVDESCLHTLQKRKLVNRSESDTVTVHDVLRSMGIEKAKRTRLTNYEEFLKVKDDTSSLRNIKGLALLITTSLTSLDCKHLNAMHNSLRVLQLGDWVRFEDPPCVDAFEELRYLQIGDLKDFPFKDVSKLKKLAVFHNSSKPGMELDQLPPNLKHIFHQVPYRDCNAFTKIPLIKLKSLERFRVGSKRFVCLPQGFELPASLVNLELIGCRNLPKRFDKLTALESLILDKCDMKCLPGGFEKLNKLKHLSMEHCTNLIILPDRLGFSDALTYLSLQGCTGLEKLPAGLEMLHTLQKLNIAECENLSALPDAFNELSALQMLELRGCISLQKLPDSFGRLHLQTLDLDSLYSLQGLPESFGNLQCLTKLSLSYCSSLVNLPMGFGELSSLEELDLVFLSLSSLPDGFGKLKNLKMLTIDRCYKLDRVSPDFQNLVSLKELCLTRCFMLNGAAMDKIVKLQKCSIVDIERSTKLIERWDELKRKTKNMPCG